MEAPRAAEAEGSEGGMRAWREELELERELERRTP